MNFIETRGNDGIKPIEVPFSEAILNPSTSFGGLYVPKNLPTLEDNFPTTNIEALACGTPVVTFETGGSGESVTRECGRVVPKGNIMLLAEAIREMAELDPTRTAKLCRAQAQNYEKNERYLEYRTLYHEIVKKESRR